MTKKIKLAPPKTRRVNLSPPRARRIDPEEVRKALGGEPTPAEDVKKLKTRFSP